MNMLRAPSSQGCFTRYRLCQKLLRSQIPILLFADCHRFLFTISGTQPPLRCSKAATTQSIFGFTDYSVGCSFWSICFFCQFSPIHRPFIFICWIFLYSLYLMWRMCLLKKNGAIRDVCNKEWADKFCKKRPKYFHWSEPPNVGKVSNPLTFYFYVDQSATQNNRFIATKCDWFVL